MDSTDVESNSSGEEMVDGDREEGRFGIGKVKNVGRKLLRGLFPPEETFKPESPKRFIEKFAPEKGFFGPFTSPLVVSFWGGLVTFAAIATIGAIHQYASMMKFPMLFAFEGAAATLLFAIPNAAGSQPKPMVLGSALSAVTAITIKIIFGSTLLWLQGALAVSISVFLMQLAGATNPPGGALALFYITAPEFIVEQRWLFIAEALVGTFILLIYAFVANNIVSWSRYPLHYL